MAFIHVLIPKLWCSHSNHTVFENVIKYFCYYKFNYHNISKYNNALKLSEIFVWVYPFEPVRDRDL